MRRTPKNAKFRSPKAKKDLGFSTFRHIQARAAKKTAGRGCGPRPNGKRLRK